MCYTKFEKNAADHAERRTTPTHTPLQNAHCYTSPSRNSAAASEPVATAGGRESFDKPGLEYAVGSCSRGSWISVTGLPADESVGHAGGDETGDGKREEENETGEAKEIGGTDDRSRRILLLEVLKKDRTSAPLLLPSKKKKHLTL